MLHNYNYITLEKGIKMKEKLRIKNLTGGYIVIEENGKVKFDLYPEDKDRKNKKGRLRTSRELKKLQEG